jgi:hypothetical protein
MAVELLNYSGNLVGRMLAGAAHPPQTTGDYLSRYMAHLAGQSADLGCSRPHRAILRLFDRTVRALPGPGTAPKSLDTPQPRSRTWPAPRLDEKLPPRGQFRAS